MHALRRSSTTRVLVLRAAAAGFCLALVLTGCSSGEEAGGNADGEQDQGTTGQQAGTNPDGGGAGTNGDGANFAAGRVCDVIEPALEEVAARFGEDLSVTIDSVSSPMASMCAIKLTVESESGPLGAGLVVKLLPSLYRDVASAAELYDYPSMAAPGTGDGVLIDTGGNGATVLMSSGGRVIAVEGNYSFTAEEHGVRPVTSATAESAAVIKAYAE
ncbi:hypothetical protein [Nocardioides sp. AE5]|uniref:hypothetical protein n=1 Tax=Nocardioides sp. AE5 TaxID=2962573 RepID=UPI0028821CC3|nr:hypothetical protein [Nocardioides sp. AE5]MDT0203446.1 hypothetical protein [Nocardioides sp. AE5]